jgi:hypothetical protein
LQFSFSFARSPLRAFLVVSSSLASPRHWSPPFSFICHRLLSSHTPADAQIIFLSDSLACNLGLILPPSRPLLFFFFLLDSPLTYITMAPVPLCAPNVIALFLLSRPPHPSLVSTSPVIDLVPSLHTFPTLHLLLRFFTLVRFCV